MDTYFKKPDIILYLLLVIACVCLFLFIPREPGENVEVFVDGKQVAVYPLSRDTTQIIEGVGGTDMLVIREGEAMIEQATCPDCLCVKSGRISRAGQCIICLPNRVSVRISGSVTDAISY